MPSTPPELQNPTFQQRMGQAVHTLTTAGGDANRLRISHGDYYMLVFGEQGSTEVEVEVVANRFLPRPAHLTSGRLEVVTQKGFSATVRNRANLQRCYDLADQDAGGGLIGEVVDIFQRAFGCDDLGAATLDLQLQDRDPTKNPELLRAMKRLARLRDHSARQQVYRALLVADLLLLVADETHSPHKVEELSGFPVFAVFTDYTALRMWQPLGFRYHKIRGYDLFPRLAALGIGSLLINPKGNIGGELYRNEVDGLANAAARYRNY